MSSDSTNINGRAKAHYTYDAIVIGSGISGSWAAKGFTGRGLKTIKPLNTNYRIKKFSEF